jgi:hypothetical protein
MTSDSQEQGSSKGSPTVSELPTVLELQRMALQKALSSLELAAPQSVTSCNTGSCNHHPT